MSWLEMQIWDVGLKTETEVTLAIAEVVEVFALSKAMSQLLRFIRINSARDTFFTGDFEADDEVVAALGTDTVGDVTGETGAPVDVTAKLVIAGVRPGRQKLAD